MGRRAMPGVPGLPGLVSTFVIVLLAVASASAATIKGEHCKEPNYAWMLCCARECGVTWWLQWTSSRAGGHSTLAQPQWAPKETRCDW